MEALKAVEVLVKYGANLEARLRGIDMSLLLFKSFIG